MSAIDDHFDVKPCVTPPLDPSFLPAAVVDRAFLEAARSSSDSLPLVLGLERGDGEVSRYETVVFAPSDARAAANLCYVERLVKFLLWQRGAFRVHVGGNAAIAKHISIVYSPEGARAFDVDFMGRAVYGKPFEVVACGLDDVPAENESAFSLGRHLAGNRIGFDLGASDLKVSAVVDGTSIYSEEIVWEPRKHSDPTYHYEMIMAGLNKAVSKLPSLDAIGGSSAGIYVDNAARVASLFRAIPEDRFDEVRSMFHRIRDEFGVPLQIINDGDVSALAGSMSMDAMGVLGLAFGSSEAAGYVALDGSIKGWLNELAFAPIDYSPDAPTDEWSGDRGCGVQYLSQQCVFRLAEKAGIPLREGVTDAEKLKAVQQELESDHDGAQKIWESMGCYLGYALAHYAAFYEIEHVLLLGRCTSGRGGDMILEGARHVLREDFPEIGDRVNIQLPDEKTRRVGQSVAAASLPALED